MEMKLKRMDGHDSDNNNFGPDLIDWTRVSDVDEDGFIEWDITVSRAVRSQSRPTAIRSIV